MGDGERLRLFVALLLPNEAVARLVEWQERELGGRPVVLYPLFHPAAALRTPRVLEELREDFSRVPELLERERERARERAAPAPERASALAAMAASMGAGAPEEPDPPPQLGLFGSS